MKTLEVHHRMIWVLWRPAAVSLTRKAQVSLDPMLLNGSPPGLSSGEKTNNSPRLSINPNRGQFYTPKPGTLLSAG